ncbi:hypothetical protein BgiMline_033976, partial [Biomphalaria glabrata]
MLQLLLGVICAERERSRNWITKDATKDNQRSIDSCDDTADSLTASLSKDLDGLIELV